MTLPLWLMLGCMMLKSNLPYLMVVFEKDVDCKRFYSNLNVDTSFLNKENQFFCEEFDSNILKIQASGEEAFFYNFYYTLADVLSLEEYPIMEIKIKGATGSSDIAFILVAGGIKKELITIESSGEGDKFKNEHTILNDVLAKMRALSAS